MDNQNLPKAPQEEQNTFFDYAIEGQPFMEQGKVYPSRKSRNYANPKSTRSRESEKVIRKAIKIY